MYFVIKNNTVEVPAKPIVEFELIKSSDGDVTLWAKNLSSGHLAAIVAFNPKIAEAHVFNGSMKSVGLMLQVGSA